MNEKKQQILESAIKCFSEKGFHATSIQDIANDVGIAKGSIYIYFKSKDDLLISALLYTFEDLKHTLLEISNHTALTADERLFQLISAQIKLMKKYSDFTMRAMSEQAVRFENQLRDVFLEMQMYNVKIYYQAVVAVYGEEIEKYAFDSVVMLQAICSQFTLFSLITKMELKEDKLIGFLLDRLHDSIQGMVAKQKEPIIDITKLMECQASHISGGTVEQDSWLADLNAARTAVEELSLEERQKEEIFSYLLVLERELSKSVPQTVMIQSILEDLQGMVEGKLEGLFEPLIERVRNK